MARRWQPAEDRALIFYGKLVGYAHVARHDLKRRSPGAARARMRRLRRKSPDRVARIEREAAAEGMLA